MPSREEWIPPPGGELLRMTKPLKILAWGIPADIEGGKGIRTKAEEQWQAFDSTDGKGTWWWNRNTEDWFLESEPGNWTQFTDSENGQPHWCHPDGRCFCASLDPWLVEE